MLRVLAHRNNHYKKNTVLPKLRKILFTNGGLSLFFNSLKMGTDLACAFQMGTDLASLIWLFCLESEIAYRRKDGVYVVLVGCIKD